MPEEEKITDDDPCKAKLLEALCHSQTRARVAENAAKQAYTEKEHILKLFFRQASQLFAYKQWFKILQLENLLLQTEDDLSPPPADYFHGWPKNLGKNCIKAGRRQLKVSDVGETHKKTTLVNMLLLLLWASLSLGRG